MKAIQPNTKTIIQNHQFLLLVLAGSISGIFISTLWKTNDSNFLAASVVYLASVASSIWEKRDKLTLESGFFATLCGLLLIALVFFNSLFAINSGIPIGILLFISALSLALVASGYKGLKQYWMELLALFFLSASKVLVPFIADISQLTASFSATLLLFTGFEVILSDYKVILPTGSIEVFPFCSGMDLILQMLGISILFFLTFPYNWSWVQKIIVPTLAATIGFIVNAIRIAIMAVLVAKGDNGAFQYWHGGDGSLVFSLAAVVPFGLFCWFLLSIKEAKEQKVDD